MGTIQGIKINRIWFLKFSTGVECRARCAAVCEWCAQEARHKWKWLEQPRDLRGTARVHGRTVSERVKVSWCENECVGDHKAAV